MKKYWKHKTVEVEKGAVIGDGTKIWQNSIVQNGVKVGKSCNIGRNCFLEKGAIIGNGVKIKSNTEVWDKVVLEDYVFVGPSVVFTNDPNPRSKYPKSKFPEYGRWLPTLIKEGASVGANATILCGTQIGKWSLIGAGAVVTKDVPDYALVLGVPARIAGWICECGNKIFFEKERATCSICAKKYKKEGEKVFLIS